ncbi:hypothetical protein D0T84_07095 [Dysgonomonas sp. 521]|uniref:glycoside hydrolase family 71/99-like protein n=1 Tax=Dysgonomonas sp. 521 TaxID=2302932 RepID=UPI0013D33CBA|nr:glycoside hydrolase family 71/99-like protein [Dysgonomonas sp. 521]NDV94684.1 hypothetical protein [Dysgonomonas sp. 521]
MKKLLFIILFCCGIVLLSGCSKDDLPIIKENPVEEFDPVAVTKTNPMKLYVHYMPWFETPATNNGAWGQHWTMANKNPDSGEIASYYNPLIGPYASSDEAVIEYHLLLMKYSGIDGILIDWYGTRDLWDYPANKKNTEAIVKVLEKVGLNFAIVYEDQTVKEELEGEAQITQAKADMKYLEDNFFGKSNYIKIGNKPLLMVFGPQEIKTPTDWTNVFSAMKTKPSFVTLYGHSNLANNADNKNASGEFIWVDATSMETKYAIKDNFEVFFGGAYPGYKDFYKEGGWGESALAAIDHKDGALLKELLQMAKSKNVSNLQLITWNDFGEGTMIEPTKEFGYKFLNEIQSFSGVSYSTSTLENVYDYYNLRAANKGKVKAEKKLTQAFYYFVSLQNEKAKALLDEVKNGN